LLVVPIRTAHRYRGVAIHPPRRPQTRNLNPPIHGEKAPYSESPPSNHLGCHRPLLHGRSHVHGRHPHARPRRRPHHHRLHHQFARRRNVRTLSTIRPAHRQTRPQLHHLFRLRH